MDCIQRTSVPYECPHIRDLDPKVAGCSDEIYTQLYPGERVKSIVSLDPGVVEVTEIPPDPEVETGD